MQSFKNLVKQRIRNGLGLSEIEKKLGNIRQLIFDQLRVKKITDDEFVMILEYPPSRDYQPRWGYTHPPHTELTALFAKNRANYVKILEELSDLKPFFEKINRFFPSSSSEEPGWVGGPINAIDSALLYYFVATSKPRIYLEIGSGVTTLFAARAKRDRDLETRIISIDPQPRAEVDKVCDTVIREGLETVDLSIFSKLQAGDIVFMDGTHRSFMNSDVTIFMLDVLPKLQPGVIVHFHDIVLPYDYPPSFSNWYWNEQYILAAYLLGKGDKIEILMPSQFMSRTPELKQVLTPLLEIWQEDVASWLEGGSLWFTHV
ncbi:MAG: class I SAM-dependent methyltransferase [Cyanobacteriota bacterium]|nr:class I SAM-dependent methyltransferase [Cyanobacteriota bacterium]